MTKQEDELKKLVSEIKEVSSRIAALSSDVQELKTNFSQDKTDLKINNWKMFWTGAILGIVTGTLGGLLNAYVMKIYDFIQVPLSSWIASTIIVAVLITALLLIMRKIAKSPPQELI